MGPPILSDLTEGGWRTYIQKLRAEFGSALIAYWTGNDKSGTIAVDSSGNGRDGTYTAVTLGQTGIGDGGSSVLYDGTTSKTNVFSTSLQSAFNGAEGSLFAWLQVSASGVWTDGIQRLVGTFRADNNNRCQIDKSANNTMRGLYVAGGTAKAVSIGSQTSTGWLHLAMTWSKAADQLKVYLNGAQQGTTQTGLGAFAGSIASTSTVIGSFDTTPSLVWSGYIAHVALLNRPATAAEVAAAYALQG